MLTTALILALYALLMFAGLGFAILCGWVVAKAVGKILR